MLLEYGSEGDAEECDGCASLYTVASLKTAGLGKREVPHDISDFPTSVGPTTAESRSLNLSGTNIYQNQAKYGMLDPSACPDFAPNALPHQIDDTDVGLDSDQCQAFGFFRGVGLMNERPSSIDSDDEELGV